MVVCGWNGKGIHEDLFFKGVVCRGLVPTLPCPNFSSSLVKGGLEQVSDL